MLYRYKLSRELENSMRHTDIVYIRDRWYWIKCVSATTHS